MDRSVNFFADQLIGIRSGVISPGVIDTVRVEYHGTRVPISHVAMTASDQRRVMVQPYDPQMLGTIDQALKQAGFNAYISSKTQVVISFSALSGEQRARVIAHVGRLAEEAKVAVRNIRRKARQKLTREELMEAEGALQQMTDEAIERIEELKQSKLRSL
jgi:ribosome recycling factor